MMQIIGDDNLFTLATVPDIPVVMNTIPSLSVDYGVRFEYSIPNATFYDYQDGWSSDLKLTLLDTQGQVTYRAGPFLITNSILRGIIELKKFSLIMLYLLLFGCFHSFNNSTIVVGE